MALKTIKFSKGDILCYQNELSDELYILLSGQLEVLATDSDTKDKKNLINMSSRIAIIDTPKTPFGEISFILKQPRTASIRALTDGTCAVFKGSMEELSNLIKSNPQIGISIALTVIKRYKKCKEILLTANNLFKEIQILNDNFSYTYYKFVKSAKTGEQISKEHKNDDIFKYGKQLEERIISSGQTPPNQLSIALLETDLGKLFNKKYGITNLATPGNIDYELALFFENLLAVPIEYLNVIMATRPFVIYFMSQKLVKYILIFNARVLESEKIVEKEFSRFAGENGCFAKLYGLYKEFKEAEIPNLTLFERIITVGVKSIKSKMDKYLDIWGKPFTQFDKDFKTRLNDLLAAEQKIEEQKYQEHKARIIEASEFNPTNQLEKLMSIDYIPQHIKDNLKNSYNEYLKISDKFETGGEPKKIKKNLIEKYWDFAKCIYKKYLSTGDIAPYELYMIRFGILDDLLLDDKTINAFKLVKYDTESSKYPIYYVDEWIERIYNQNDEPSINELGQTYKEYLKEAGIAETSLSSEEFNWNFGNYEIDSMLKSAVKTCAGSLSTQIPMLDKDFIVGNPESILLNKERLEKIIDTILAKTYSLFYREVRVIYESQKSDYIRKEIAPVFILIPVAGSRVVCWQELVGGNKSSRGRILVPILPTENIENMLKWGLACFNWELNKSIAGYSWGDPIEGGMTGKYFDYTSTYKQNKDINDETKTQINDLFKKYTTTRERFAAEYMLWYDYESEAIVKLNKLSREIFYMYVPFTKKIRDKLAKTPTFEHLARRFDNLAKKDLQVLETKIKKLQIDNMKVPQELIDAMNYYKI